jgi:hypothetical protein
VLAHIGTDIGGPRRQKKQEVGAAGRRSPALSYLHPEHHATESKTQLATP